MKNLENVISNFEEEKGVVEAKKNENIKNMARATKMFEDNFETAYRNIFIPAIDNVVNLLKKKNYCVKMVEERPKNGNTEKTFLKKTTVHITTEKRRELPTPMEFFGNASYFEIVPKHQKEVVLIRQRIYPNYESPIEKSFSLETLNPSALEKELEGFVQRVFDPKKLR